MCVFQIDKALCVGNCQKLMEITEVERFEGLLSNDVQSSYEQCTNGEHACSPLRQPNLEAQL